MRTQLYLGAIDKRCLKNYVVLNPAFALSALVCIWSNTLCRCSQLHTDTYYVYMYFFSFLSTDFMVF